MNLIPVILCGGSGTRLWPLSRKSYPKQFLSLASEKSLFQDTLTRATIVSDAEAIVITNNDYRFLAAEQIKQSEPESSVGEIILEPDAKNTAPAIAVAALKALNHNKRGSPYLLVMPADHAIVNTQAFIESVQQAKSAAQKGKLVTFGIVPDKPETGYGYIQSATINTDSSALAVKQFVEKPELKTAKKYLEEGNYFWNSGIFLFRAERYIEELEKHNPEMVNACKAAIYNGKQDLDFFRLEQESFSACPEDSIDYAVMEKSNDVVVVPLNAGWSDIGSWSALAEVHTSDTHGNVGKGDTLLLKSKNCYVHSEKKLVTTLGVEDLVIVDTPDALLVANKDKVQDVKQIVRELEREEREVATSHRETYRPWGKYDSVDKGQRFQVKRITVNPGETLSLQKHYHRAEHWIVVSGIAEVTRDEDTFNISENESVYIPLGAVHRLSNPGKIPLELIEVQSGSYLGEDDIIRLDDNYGRKKIRPVNVVNM